MSIQYNLKKWFKQQARVLPWRDNPSPYRVWISEIMLQQTQVAVVQAYFEKWMQAFPTLVDLANAPLEQVLKLWEGLGYYSRARHLHAAAKQLMQDNNGEITLEVLDKIKGVGPYTKAAILNFAFHQKAPALDGNVMRVLSRLQAIKDPIDLGSTKRLLTARLEALLPDEQPWIFSEALIELGAIICTKSKPQCITCPIQEHCLAYKHQLTDQLPIKSPQCQPTYLTRYVAVVAAQEHLFIRQVEKGKVMADLYEFPYHEHKQQLEEFLAMPLIEKGILPTQKHSFTRYHVTLLPILYTATEISLSNNWRPRHMLDNLPFSSGHRRVLHSAINALRW